MARKKKDRRGKVVVIILLRGPDNSYVRGNMMKTFTLSGQKVSIVARSLEKPVVRMRRKP